MAELGGLDFPKQALVDVRVKKLAGNDIRGHGFTAEVLSFRGNTVKQSRRDSWVHGHLRPLEVFGYDR